MPWVKAGEISPGYKEHASIALANPVPIVVAYRFKGIGGLSPFPYGFLTTWQLHNLPDASAIELARAPLTAWRPTGIFPVLPSLEPASISRIGFQRNYPPSGIVQIALYYFTL